MTEKEENKKIRESIVKGSRKAFSEVAKSENMKPELPDENDRVRSFERALARREEFLYLKNKLFIRKGINNEESLQMRAEHNACFLLG